MLADARNLQTYGNVWVESEKHGEGVFRTQSSLVIEGFYVSWTHGLSLEKVFLPPDPYNFLAV